MDKQKRLALPLGVLAVFAILIVFSAGCAGEQQASATAEEETAVAFIGDLSASTTASGQVQSGQEAALSAKTPARVDGIFVRVGDAVQAGDVLMQLDGSDLALNVDIARQNLFIKEANLADLLAPAEESDILAAETAVSSARSALEDLQDGPSETDIAVAKANLRASQASLWSASADLAGVNDSVTESQIAAAEAALIAAQLQQKNAREANEKETNQTTHDALQAANQAVAAAQAQLDALQAGPNSGQLGAAQGSLAAANARADGSQADLNQLIAGATAVQLANAESQLAQAEATLANLLDGPTDEQITIAEAEVEQARLNLADAESALAEASITAPFAGVVTAVHVNEGEIASSSLLELINNESLEVVLEIDEVDVGNLAPGQAATITLETWPDIKIPSEVLLIAPSAKNDPTSQLVTYEAHLILGATDLPVRIGMTANANLITSDKQDVLLVPNRAINADRTAGTYSVVLVVGDTMEEVPVKIGLRDNQNTEILDGLQAGDVVLTSSNLPTFNFGRPEEGEENRGGNGGPPFGS